LGGAAAAAVANPSYFEDWDGPAVTAWVNPAATGDLTESVSGNIATVQTGDVVAVGDYYGIQFDGVTEYAAFAADSSYFSGITTECTIDAIVRMDDLGANEALLGLTGHIDIGDNNDTFVIRTNASSAWQSRTRASGSTKTTSIGAGGTPVNGTTYHVRIVYDSATLLRARFYVNDMSTHILQSPAIAESSALQNAGVTLLTFGAIEDGTSNAAITFIEFMVRSGIHSDQLAEFS